MTANYKGFSINVERDKTVIEDEIFMWSVTRLSDGEDMHSGHDFSEVFGEGATVRSELKSWKNRIDEFLQLPEKEQVTDNF